MPRLAVCYIVHDDAYYLAQSIASFKSAGDVLVFVSRVPWHDQPGDWETTARIAQEAGARVVLGEWTSELTHRQATRQYLLDHGYTHALIPDGDEIIEPRLLQHLCQIAEAELADRVHFHWDAYWKSPEYLIRPREPFTPLILLDLRAAYPIGGRDFEGGRRLVLSEAYGVIHHLSYVGPEERIQRKIRTWGHRDEVLEGWYEQVWKGWDQNHLMPHLHPTRAAAYGRAERIVVPPLLQPALARYRELTGETEPLPLPRPPNWPKVSLIIPLHGGVEEITACLDSLEPCRDLLQETIVVDNASPDGAEEVAASRPWVRLLRNETNRGFAIASNQGAAEATGEVLLFLNSDTLVPRCALLRLIEVLLTDEEVAATGPYSNRTGHFQQITPTYSSLATLDLFAEDFARRPLEDVETDMLVGFCLAVRRPIWEEIGGFDEQFQIGTYEDTDLCYRMRRAGYRLKIASRSFVYHAGSKTLVRLGLDIRTHMTRNQAQYRQKWRRDLESGYASNLSGLTLERIRFDPSRLPETRALVVTEWARSADITLCLLVRDEKEDLAEALRGTGLFFPQIVVVVSNSTDRAAEIAREHGAEVVVAPRTDNVSEARNMGLRRARGQWIVWMDAEETLPWNAAEALLKAAMNAPEEIVGFMVPVQDEQEGSSAPGAQGDTGTWVSQIRLFRNRPGLRFEGRVQEQILPSLLQGGGQIARCEAWVLRPGSERSPQERTKQHKRDLLLLALDLQDRPNHPLTLFLLGRTCQALGDHPKAIRWLRLCLQCSRVTESHVGTAWVLLGLSLRETQPEEACLEALQQGLQIAPKDPELHVHLAHSLTALGRFAEAKAHFLQALEADGASGFFTRMDPGIRGYKTDHGLGQVCFRMDRYQEARDWWRKALESAPQYPPTVSEWFDAALQIGDTLSAHALLMQVHITEGLTERWAQMGVRYAERLGGTAGADEFLQQNVASAPTNVAMRLALARRLMQSGRDREAQLHLRWLNTLGIAEAASLLGETCTRQGDPEGALDRSAAPAPPVPSLEAAVADPDPQADGSQARLNRLRQAHPYPTQKPEVPPSKHGWLQEQTALALAQPLSEATQVVVELGAWLGRSALFLAEQAPKATIISIDHWQGSTEQQEHPGLRTLLPILYETFCVNCWEERHRIIPVRLSTLEGMTRIAQAGIVPEVIYVDAAHDYESVRQDVEMALQLFPHSVLVGDDWDREGVQQGVLQAVLEHRRERDLHYNLTAWWLTP